MGLGSHPTVMLKEAHEKAADAHKSVRGGIDPVAAHRALKSAISWFGAFNQRFASLEKTVEPARPRISVMENRDCRRIVVIGLTRSKRIPAPADRRGDAIVSEPRPSGGSKPSTSRAASGSTRRDREEAVMTPYGPRRADRPERVGPHDRGRDRPSLPLRFDRRPETPRPGLVARLQLRQAAQGASVQDTARSDQAHQHRKAGPVRPSTKP